MTPQELKNSILQLAIQGKLVEQREEEGTAEELYQQIQAEKQELIKAKKIKKGKALPEITEDEVPFEIPESWKWVRVAELGEVIGGGTPKTGIAEYWDNEGIPWITPADMKYVAGKYVEHGERYISQLGLDKSSAQLMPKGTVLYSSRAPIGYIAIAASNISTNQGFKSLVPTVLEINEYMYYCLIARTKDIIGRASGTTFKEISGTDFGRTLIPFPPIAEQRRIVAKIEELLPYIDRYEKAWNRLEDFNKRFPVDMQKSILQMAIQGKLVEQRPEEGTGEELYQQIQAEKQELIQAKKIKKGKALPEITEDEVPFEIPETWKWVRIDELFVVGTGMTPLKGEKLFYENGTVPWVTSTLTSNRYIRNTDTFVTQYALDNTSLTVYPPHTIIIAMYGQGKTRGQVSELLISATINQACAALGNIISEEVFVHYIYYFFEYNYELLRKKAEGTSQPNLNLSKIKEYAVPLPPLAEQKRIVERLEELLPLCERFIGGKRNGSRR